MSNKKDPEEMQTKHIDLRITQMLHKALKETSKTTGLSVNSIICTCINLQLHNVQGCIPKWSKGR